MDTFAARLSNVRNACIPTVLFLHVVIADTLPAAKHKSKSIFYPISFVW